MFTSVELRRILNDWKIRFQRARAILSPVVWEFEDWQKFSRALLFLVERYGERWKSNRNTRCYDLRWKTKDGGELVCQVESNEEEVRTLIVAQVGGFASEVGSYTWLWAEFDGEGIFLRDPYYVDGTWKEALVSLIMPLQSESALYLANNVSEQRFGIPLLEGSSEEMVREDFHEENVEGQEDGEEVSARESLQHF